MNINGDYKKITLAGTEAEIKFPRNYPVFGVKGENITVALTAGAVSNTRSTADTDGVVMWAHHKSIDAMYLTGTGDAIVWAGDRAEECPFNKKGKGGDSGGGEESQFVMPRVNVYGYNTIDGRTWQVLNNTYGGIRPTPAGQTAGQTGWLTLDPTQSYEIGTAIKTSTTNGHLLVYSGDGNGWSQTPFCEYADGKLIFYIDSNGRDPWDVLIQPMESDNWPAMQVNQWYFFKFAYDGNGKYTGAYTSDFDTWYTFEKTSSITHYKFDTFGYSNGSLYSKSDIIYDIGNLYVKQNDQMVWGNYLGNFPD